MVYRYDRPNAFRLLLYFFVLLFASLYIPFNCFADEKTCLELFQKPDQTADKKVDKKIDPNIKLLS